MKGSFSERSECLHITEAGDGQAFLVGSIVRPAKAARATAVLYTEIAHYLHNTGSEIVQERIFGSLSVAPVVQSARKAALQAGNIDIAAQGPIHFIQGHPPWGPWPPRPRSFNCPPVLPESSLEDERVLSGQSPVK